MFPLLIFMGVGAMTDFGPLLANPKTLFLGAAAQFGIFATLLGALGLSELGIFNFSVSEAAAIGIIGGADGPTAIYVAGQLAPHLLGCDRRCRLFLYGARAAHPAADHAFADNRGRAKDRDGSAARSLPARKNCISAHVAAIALRWLCRVRRRCSVCFALVILMRECGVVNRLSDTTQNALVNITTIFLGLAVGSKLRAEQFLVVETLGILLLGMVAFCIGTAAGVLMAKIMNLDRQAADQSADWCGGGLGGPDGGQSGQ